MADLGFVPVLSDIRVEILSTKYSRSRQASFFSSSSLPQSLSYLSQVMSALITSLHLLLWVTSVPLQTPKSVDAFSSELS